MFRTNFWATASRPLRARSRGCRPRRTVRSAPQPRPTPLPWPRLQLLIGLFASNVHWSPPQISATFKIGLGLVQCLSTLRSFTKVRWPQTFVVLIEAMDYVLIEAFAVVPAECIVGTCPHLEPMAGERRARRTGKW